MQNNTLNKNAESSKKADNVSISLNRKIYYLININLQKEPQSSVNTRSRRIIKKVKEDESFISDINEVISGQEKKPKNQKKNQNASSNSQNNKSSSINKDFLDEDEMNEMIPNDNNEIVMEGNLFYRYGMDQIELDGVWSLSSEVAKCHFSYLLSCKQKVIKIHIDPKDLGIKDISQNNNDGGNSNIQGQSQYINNQNGDINHNIANNNMNGNEIKDMNNNGINNIYNIMMNNKYFDLSCNKYILNLCSANIFEALLIPDYELFKYILTFLSGEYHGFFVYFGKTIEDCFNLNFNYEDNQVRVSGSGKNNLGDFNIIGYVNFFTMKDQLLSNNAIESEVIKFGVIKLTRIYSDFNSNENNRVIKSFQHSRKKYEDFTDQPCLCFQRNNYLAPLMY